MNFKVSSSSKSTLSPTMLWVSSDDDDDDSGGDDGCGGGQSSSFKYSWLIAVILCVLSAVISNFGTNLQKLAWNKRRKAREALEGNGTYLSLTTTSTNSAASLDANGENKFRRFWMMGFAAIVIGSLFDFAALGFGAQSVVAPLGSLTLVANMGFAQVMHGEKLSQRDLLATGVIFAGCVLSVTFASHKNEICDLDALMGLYAKPRFALYASTIILLLLVGVFAARHMERVITVYGARSRKYRKLFKYHRFCYTFLSGVAGAQSILFAKSLDELLVSSFTGDSKIFLTHIGSYLIAFSMFCSIALQIYWLNCALARWDALYVVPVFQAQWIVFSVIGGGVFYGEFAGFSFGQAIAFLVGVLFTVLGVYFLSQRDVATSHATASPRPSQHALDTSILTSVSELESTGSRRQHHHHHLMLLEEVEDEPYFLDEATGGILNESLGTPLLSGKPRRVYETRPHEYDITFDAQQIGVTVEPHSIPISGGEQLKLWRVRATRLGARHPIKVGHCIVAVNGESVVDPNADLTSILDNITDGPRPMTIRFRTEPTTEQPYQSSSTLHTSTKLTRAGSSARHDGSIVDDEERLSSSADEVEGDDDDDEEEEGDGQTASSATSSRHRATSSSLQGVALNPLLELIHTWKQSGPSAYDSPRQDQQQHNPYYSPSSHVRRQGRSTSSGSARSTPTSFVQQHVEQQTQQQQGSKVQSKLFDSASSSQQQTQTGQDTGDESGQSK